MAVLLTENKIVSMLSVLCHILEVNRTCRKMRHLLLEIIPKWLEQKVFVFFFSGRNGVEDKHLRYNAMCCSRTQVFEKTMKDSASMYEHSRLFGSA